MRDSMPGTKKMRQGKEPHGATRNAYVNQLALKAINEKTGAWPDGAGIVRGNSMPDKGPAAVTTLHKKKGFTRMTATGSGGTTART